MSMREKQRFINVFLNVKFVQTTIFFIDKQCTMMIITFA